MNSVQNFAWRDTRERAAPTGLPPSQRGARSSEGRHHAGGVDGDQSTAADGKMTSIRRSSLRAASRLRSALARRTPDRGHAAMCPGRCGTGMWRVSMAKPAQQGEPEREGTRG